MRPHPVALDLTRLVTRLSHASPTGIDRVDLAYARHLLGQPGPRFGLVSTPLGPKVLDRGQMAGLVEAAVAAWTEEVAAGDDPVYRDLSGRLGLPVPAPAPRPGSRRVRANAAGASSRPGSRCCGRRARKACR